MPVMSAICLGVARASFSRIFKISFSIIRSP
jgi:hypothetical protein